MPDVTYPVTILAPLARTWDFVSDMRNWAELMPGYQAMDTIDDANSTWKIKGDVGILSKLVTLDVHIAEWVTREHVDFTYKCREEPLEAQGSLRAEADGARATRLTFYLAAQAGGMLGPVVNALLAKVLPGMARDFADAVKQKVEAQEPGLVPTA